MDELYKLQESSEPQFITNGVKDFSDDDEWICIVENDGKLYRFPRKYFENFNKLKEKLREKAKKN